MVEMKAVYDTGTVMDIAVSLKYYMDGCLMEKYDYRGSAGVSTTVVVVYVSRRV